MFVQHRFFSLLFIFALLTLYIRPIIAQDDSSSTQGLIVVGSKDSTEQRLLGKMLVVLLKDAGYRVEDKTGMGDSAAVRAAIESGAIDLYPEYTATALSLFNDLPLSGLPTDPERTFALAKSLDAAKELIWLEPSPINNTYALFVRQELATAGTETLQDLATLSKSNQNPLKLCLEQNFAEQTEEGWEALEQRYGFQFQTNNVRIMSQDQVYVALQAKQCDVAVGTTTDGRIAAWDLYALADPLAFFPFNQLTPVVRQPLLDQHPDLKELLAMLMQKLDVTIMRQLNAQVDLGADGKPASGDEEDPEIVAHRFLSSQELLKPPTIKVGSQNTTQQLILGKLLVTLLQDAGYNVVDATGMGNAKVVRAALEKGEIDLTVEQIGTALTLFKNLPAEGLPPSPERALTLLRRMDAASGLIWEARGAFNDTYVFVVGQDQWNKGIHTLDDLAKQLNSDTVLTLCTESTFFSDQNGGLPALQSHYGFAFANENVFLMDADEVYTALRAGDCDVGQGHSTDSRIAAWDLHILEDNQVLYPINNPAPVIRQDVLAVNPSLPALLNRLLGIIDDATIQDLNALVDIGTDNEPASGDEQTPADVAYNFLLTKGLIKLPPIKIGSTNSTQQLILGQMLLLLLQDAGQEVVDMTGVGNTQSVREALENGEIDLYIEQIGTALTVFKQLPAEGLPSNPERALALIKRMDAEAGLVWLNRGVFNDTYVLLVKQELWDKGIKTIDDLGKALTNADTPLTFCNATTFFLEENGGLTSLQTFYGFAFSDENILLMDPDEVYGALQDGDCDVAQGHSTDGRIGAWGLHILEDTQAFFPINNPAPVVHKRVLDINPDLAAIVNKLLPTLNDATMQELNALVDIGPDGKSSSGDEGTPKAVARSFLEKAKLIKPGEQEPAAKPTEDAQPTKSSGAIPPALSAMIALFIGEQGGSPTLPAPDTAQDADSTIVVGSAATTEQRLLGQMMVAVLSDAGLPVQDQSGWANTPMLRAALEQGMIDLYPELSGAALSVYHALRAPALPGDAARSYMLAQRLDQPAGIIWLTPFFFSKSYTLLSGPALQEQGITTLPKFAAFMQANSEPLTLCAEAEFVARRADGLIGLEEHYGFQFKPENILTMSLDETYAALRSGKCDVAEGISTDGRIAAWNLTILEDTQTFFSNYTPAPIIRQEVLQAYPEVAPVLAKLSQVLDTPTLSQLNAQVEVGPDGLPASNDEAAVRDVAITFLCEQNLLQTCPTLPTLEVTNPITTSGDLLMTDTLTMTTVLTDTPTLSTTQTLSSTPSSQ